MFYLHAIEWIVAVETTTRFITRFVVFETITPSVLATCLAFAVIFFFQDFLLCLEQGWRGLTEASPAAQAATQNARAPKDDDHAKVALELAAYGRSGACSVSRVSVLTQKFSLQVYPKCFAVDYCINSVNG